MVFSLFLTIFTQKNRCCLVLTPKWQLANIFLLRISMQSKWKFANSNRISFWTCQALLEKKTRGFRFAQYFANEHQGDFGLRRRTRFQPGNENGKRKRFVKDRKSRERGFVAPFAVKLFARSTARTFAWAVLYSIAQNNWLISLIILLIWTKIVFPMFLHCFGENKLKWKRKSDFFQLFTTRKISHFQCADFLEAAHMRYFFLKVRTLHFKTLKEIFIFIYTENWLRYDFFSEVSFFLDFHRNKLL